MLPTLLPPVLQLYVLRFLKEYLSQPWADALASSYGISTASLSECHGRGAGEGIRLC
jgi:hypothetical protein